MGKYEMLLESIKQSQKPVVLFGASPHGRRIYRLLKKFDIHPVCFCDNYKKGNDATLNIPILPPEQMVRQYPDAWIVLCILTPELMHHVKKQLEILSFPTGQMIDYDVIAKAILMKRKLQWKNDLEMDYDFTHNNVRIEKMAEWIETDDMSVIDFGAGACHLKNCLPPNATYIPTDYFARTPEFIVFDFNKDKFPEICADVSFLAYTLGYAQDWRKLLGDICRVTRKKIIIGIQIVDAVKEEIKGDTLLNAYEEKFYSEDSIIETAKIHGFMLKDQYIEKTRDIANRYHMLFTRIK